MNKVIIAWLIIDGVVATISGIGMICSGGFPDEIKQYESSKKVFIVSIVIAVVLSFIAFV